MTLPMDRQAINSPTHEVSYQQHFDGSRFRDAAPIGRLHTGVNGDVIYANSWWCSLTGVCSDNTMESGWLDVVHPDEVARVKAEWQSAVAEEREMATEFRIIRSDGIELVLFMRSAPVVTVEGTLAGFTLVIDDVTDRIRMQQALARSEASYRLLAEYSTDFISSHTPGGEYTYASPISETLLGYKPKELVGTSAYEYFHPEDLAEIAASHQRVLTAPEISTVSYRIRRKDGSYTWFETTTRNIRDPESNEITEIIAVSRDITERRKADEVDRLQSLLEAKDSFVASISHELRTPLTSLVGFAEILRSEYDTLTADERIELIETVNSESSDIAGLVDDLLVHTRAEHGTLTIVRVVVNLRAQCAQVLESVRLEERIQVVVEDHASQYLPEGDPARIRQILRNLITNATTHGRDPIRISIEHHPRTATITVSDAGTPIPDEYRDQMFDAYKHQPADTGNPNSMGLGLTVSKTLAELMGGQLSYQRTNERNSFKLSLPTITKR